MTTPPTTLQLWSGSSPSAPRLPDWEVPDTVTMGDVDTYLRTKLNCGQGVSYMRHARGSHGLRADVGLFDVYHAVAFDQNGRASNMPVPSDGPIYWIWEAPKQGRRTATIRRLG
jgi:hypothetical protein